MLKSRKFVLGLLCLIIAFAICGDAEAGLFGGGSKGAVFSGISEKTLQFAKELRKLAYVISGFGIIMFTFLAICGKINFKHLAYIVTCLFLLSGVGAFIDYTTGQKDLYYRKFDDTYIKAGKSEGSLTVKHSSL